METVLIETPVAAPAELVWDVLADFPRYGVWNPFITSIEGDLAVGAELRATFEMPGRKPRTFTPTVINVDPGHEIAWLGRLWIPGLVDATHSLGITDSDAGTVFVHREDFRGLLVPVLGSLLADTRAAFAAMNAALVARVESLAPASTGQPNRRWG